MNRSHYSRSLAATSVLVMTSGLALAEPSRQELQALGEGRLARLPMVFEANTGRFDPAVRFVSRAAGSTLFVTDGGVMVVLPPRPGVNVGIPRQAGPSANAFRGHALRLRLVGANHPARTTGLQKLAGTVNYMVGPEPAKWHTGIPTFRHVKVTGVYPGTDLVYYGNGGRLEYDFVVHPFGDPGRIHMAFDGATSLRLSDDGDLVAGTSVGEVRLKRPYAYQRVGGTRVQVACAYDLAPGGRQIALRTGRYDRNRPLVLDPTLSVASGLFQATSHTGAATVALGPDGSIYLGGFTYSGGLPTSVGALQSSFAGGSYDGIVAKLPPDASTYDYCTYLGGPGADTITGLAVDSAGCAHVAMQGPGAMPVTSGAFQTAFSGRNVGYVGKLNAGGTALVYGTYLEGRSYASANGITLDSEGHAVVCGDCDAWFPTTPGAYSAPNYGYCTFVSKLALDGKSLIWSAQYGGNDNTRAYAIHVDEEDRVTVAGDTWATDLPMTAAAVAAVKHSSPNSARTSDAFAAQLSADGSSLRYATYLGGSGDDRATGVSTDGSGRILMVGAVVSLRSGYPKDFPVTAGAAQGQLGNSPEGFACRIDPAAAHLDYCTMVRGSWSAVNSVAETADGMSVMVGYCDGGLTTTADGYSYSGGGNVQGFVAVVNGSGRFEYATYLPGDPAYLNSVAPDDSGGMVAAGAVMAGALERGIVVKLDRGVISSTVLAVRDVLGAPGQGVELSATLTSHGSAVTNRQVTFLLDGVTIGTAITDSSGVARLAYAIPGNAALSARTIVARYAGDTFYRLSAGHGVLTIDTVDTDLAITVPAYLPISSYVTVSAVLSERTAGTPIANQTVSFTLGSVSVGTAMTNDMGKATLEFLVPSDTAVGATALTATYGGSAYYTAATVSRPTTTYAGTTRGYAVGGAGKHGDKVRLYCYLYTGANPRVPLVGKPVALKVDFVSIGSFTTDRNGYGYLDLTIPGSLAVGSHLLTYTFAGDSRYIAWGTDMYLVVQPRSDLYVNSQGVAGVGGAVQLYAYLRDKVSGINYPGQTVYFLVDGVAAGSAVTDLTGLAKLQYTVPAGTTSGTHVLTAKYQGNASYPAAAATGSLVVSDLTPASMYVRSYPYATPGTKVALYCYLYTGAQRTPLVGRTVTLAVDGVDLMTSATDATGYVQYLYTVPVGSATHTVRFTFAGDSAYGGAVGTGLVTVP